MCDLKYDKCLIMVSWIEFYVIAVVVVIAFAATGYCIILALVSLA